MALTHATLFLMIFGGLGVMILGIHDQKKPVALGGVAMMMGGLAIVTFG